MIYKATDDTGPAHISDSFSYGSVFSVPGWSIWSSVNFTWEPLHYLFPQSIMLPLTLYMAALPVALD